MRTKQVEIKVLWPDIFDECEECTKRLIDGLKIARGVESVTINPSLHEVSLLYDAGSVSLDQIYEHARMLGASVNNEYSHARLRITGLDCPDCAQKLESQIKRINGVEWVDLNFATSILIVEYMTSKVSLETIHQRIRSLGYDIAQPKEVGLPETVKKFDTRLLATVVSGATLATGLVADYGFHSELVSNILYVLSAVSGAIHAARFGFLALLGRILDTNLLMTIAAIGAIILGEYAEAAAVMFLYSLGSALESITTDRTRRSIYSLIESFPKYTHLKVGDSITDIKLEDVQAGQTVVIKPGERIPLDGIVKSGVSDVNESSITGESLPVTKEAGSQAYAGSLNGTGSLEIVVSSIFSESTVAKVVRLVEEAQTQKAKSQSFSEVFGRIYTPCVVGAAVLISILGPVLLGGNLVDWVHKSLVLLVVSCPCALVISTPVAIVAAIGHLASKGVLVKGGLHLETLGRIRTMGFDKTGTITTGKLRVDRIIPSNGYTENEVLLAAAAVESRSEHPISDAILESARANGTEISHVSYFKAVLGKGAIAVTGTGQYFVGNRRFMDEKRIDTSNIETSGLVGSLVYVAREEILMGVIVVADTIRNEAEIVLNQLRKQGISRIALITGDTKNTALYTARSVGIDEVYYELLPEQKLAIVKELASEEPTALVGDGINDAPALAAAHVGIALRGLGNEAAVQSSDVVLMGDNLSVIPYAVDRSKKCRKIIIQNTVISLGTVGILIAGTFLGIVGLTAGVFGHEGSALLVIANSMRLLAGARSSNNAL